MAINKTAVVLLRNSCNQERIEFFLLPKGTLDFTYHTTIDLQNWDLDPSVTLLNLYIILAGSSSSIVMTISCCEPLVTIPNMFISSSISHMRNPIID